MLIFFITCSLSFSLIILHPSLSLPQMRLLPLNFLKNLSFPTKTTLLPQNLPLLPPKTPPQTTTFQPCPQISLLDLPDLALESILEKLPPQGLCSMSSVCTYLRDMCLCDRLWEKHLHRKWGRIVGPSAFREWCFASRKGFNEGKCKGLFGWLINLSPFGFVGSKKKDFGGGDSVMCWYFALESGKFWFPAQVYNRENGLAGFVLSCYDAMVSYDAKSDTFRARYPPHGLRSSSIESGVTWDRLRAPPVETCPHDLHISDCLHDLQPGDQVEIQWRRNKDFPYGWWYAVVSHLDTCDGDANYCRCHNSDTVVLEFQQYTRGSRWRRTIVNRKDHREEGNEATGFYGGIRKLCGNDEISTWKKLWPAQILE